MSQVTSLSTALWLLFYSGAFYSLGWYAQLQTEAFLLQGTAADGQYVQPVQGACPTTGLKLFPLSFHLCYSYKFSLFRITDFFWIQCHFARVGIPGTNPSDSSLRNLKRHEVNTNFSLYMEFVISVTLWPTIKTRRTLWCTVSQVVWQQSAQ